MRVIPLTLDQANELVGRWHRHHKRVPGCRFSIGAEKRQQLVGAAIVGRPNARLTPQYTIAEVTRCVTDGTKNACSFLYGACARIAREMGFDKIQTKTLESETGVSLKAAGWTLLVDANGEPILSDGGDWNRPSRGGRRTDQPQCPKKTWYVIFRAPTEPL